MELEKLYSSVVNWFNPIFFKQSFFTDELGDESAESVLDAVYAFMRKGATETERKAASIILRMFMQPDFYSFFMSNIAEYSGCDILDRNDRRVRKWKKRVLARGKCDICGSKESLEAHHKKPWSLFPELRDSYENGACLCHSCHCEQHRGEKVYSLMLSKGA